MKVFRRIQKPSIANYFSFIAVFTVKPCNKNEKYPEVISGYLVFGQISCVFGLIKCVSGAT
jgi:hypothetical protein